MNCFYHPETEAVAFCRTCGKPLCASCEKPALGTIYCVEHVPADTPTSSSPGTPYSLPAVKGDGAGTSPGLAFLLGLIPGVGAIYNGQYAKGVIHVVIFGLLISIQSANEGVRHFEPLFGLLIAVFYFYMPFEAYHTARKRQLGLPVDEFSSIVQWKPRRDGVPIGPILLIGLGVVFLLNTLGILDIAQILRFWPVVLIIIGVYMLYSRFTGSADVPVQREEERREQA